MPQAQHFLPQSYLRQWRGDDGKLVRYRMLTSPAKLLSDRKAPKGIAYEMDLYTLPDGGTSNGRIANEIEGILGETVDEPFAAVARLVATCSGELADRSLADRIVWLMRTFAARNPKSLGRIERGVAGFVADMRPQIDRLVERAGTAAMRQELLGFVSPNFPRVAARAGLVATVEASLPRTLSWLEGDVRLLKADDFGSELSALGAAEFVTFDDPVVEWDTNASGIAASFSLSPEVLVVVTAKGVCLSRAQCAALVHRHLLCPLRLREMLICRHAATGRLLAAAEQLVPGDW